MNTDQNYTNYTLSQTLNDIHDHELALHDSEQDHCTIRPCLSITLFFKHGAKPYVRQGLLNILNRYLELYGEYIKGGRTGDNRYAKKKIRQALIKSRII